MKVGHADPHERPGFKIVCAHCGSLSIKIENSTDAAEDAQMIRCGRCDAVRGTMSELHELARQSVDIFEF
jgi:hypothetical protein